MSAPTSAVTYSDPLGLLQLLKFVDRTPYGGSNYGMSVLATGFVLTSALTGLALNKYVAPLILRVCKYDESTASKATKRTVSKVRLQISFLAGSVLSLGSFYLYLIKCVKPLVIPQNG